MNVEIIARVDGKEVERVVRQIGGSAEEREEAAHALGKEVGRIAAREALQELANEVSGCLCPQCAEPMRHKGLRPRHLKGIDGGLAVLRVRYRCESCELEQYPADLHLGLGAFEVTVPLAKRVCQLAVEQQGLERLRVTVHDQHGVWISEGTLRDLVLQAGGVAEADRLAAAAAWEASPAEQRRWPEAEVHPDRVYVSCDGVCYCTNVSEPDPHEPGTNRLIWHEMKVGCVYWQDAQEHWHKQMIWGREEPRHFATALWQLACRCGYREAKEKIFAADGGEWCWTVAAAYFGDAQWILDWYHLMEHVHDTAKVLYKKEDDRKEWVNQCSLILRFAGGAALVPNLEAERERRRGARQEALDDLLRYLRNNLDRTDYARYRREGWQIGTGMMESTVRQLVCLRIKGSNMHWSDRGATAMTGLRAQQLNGRWHEFWATRPLQRPAA